MEKLLENPYFRLLYVTKNGISRVIPARDMDVRQDVLSNGYKCISYCWGNVKNLVWEKHDVDNVHHVVRARHATRDKCMELFKEAPGYWWMDIFCVNQCEKWDKNTDIGAINIMGDIYKNCKMCYCILDTNRSLTNKTISDVDFTLINTGFMDEKTDDGEENSLFKNVLKECDMDPATYPILKFVFQSSWVGRIWTLQECVLPNKVSLVSERVPKIKISLRDVQHICDRMTDNKHSDIKSLLDGFEREYDPDLSEEDFAKLKNGSNAMQKLAQISYEYTYISDMRRLLRNNNIKSTIKILQNLASSERKATRIVDHIVGLAGLLDITVGHHKRLESAKNSMILDLWSKNIFMLNPHLSDNDDDPTLFGIFGHNICTGIFVLHNASDLRPMSQTDANMGAIKKHIVLENYNKVTWNDSRNCESQCNSGYQFRPMVEDLCADCRKEFKENFGVMTQIYDKHGKSRVKLDDKEIMELIFGDLTKEYHRLQSYKFVENIYVTKKYFVMLPKDHKFSIGENLIIPFHGEVLQIYKGDDNLTRGKDRTGHGIGVIVSIDNKRERHEIGYIYTKSCEAFTLE